MIITVFYCYGPYLTLFAASSCSRPALCNLSLLFYYLPPQTIPFPAFNMHAGRWDGQPFSDICNRFNFPCCKIATNHCGWARTKSLSVMSLSVVRRSGWLHAVHLVWRYWISPPLVCTGTTAVHNWWLTDGQMDRQTDCQMSGQTYRQTERQTNRLIERLKDRQTGRWVGGHTDRQRDSQTARQRDLKTNTERQTERQIDWKSCYRLTD